MRTGELRLRIDVDQLFEHFKPEIDELVELRLRAKFDQTARLEGPRRNRLDALETAIDAVVKASARAEDAVNSRDETKSILALMAAASGLRRAIANDKRGL